MCTRLLEVRAVSAAASCCKPGCGVLQRCFCMPAALHSLAQAIQHAGRQCAACSHRRLAEKMLVHTHMPQTLRSSLADTPHPSYAGVARGACRSRAAECMAPKAGQTPRYIANNSGDHGACAQSAGHRAGRMCRCLLSGLAAASLPTPEARQLRANFGPLQLHYDSSSGQTTCAALKLCGLTAGCMQERPGGISRPGWQLHSSCRLPCGPGCAECASPGDYPVAPHWTRSVHRCLTLLPLCWG